MWICVALYHLILFAPSTSHRSTVCDSSSQCSHRTYMRLHISVLFLNLDAIGNSGNCQLVQLTATLNKIAYSGIGFGVTSRGSQQIFSCGEWLHLKGVLRRQNAHSKVIVLPIWIPFCVYLFMHAIHGEHV